MKTLALACVVTLCATTASFAQSLTNFGPNAPAYGDSYGQVPPARIPHFRSVLTGRMLTNPTGIKVVVTAGVTVGAIGTAVGDYNDLADAKSVMGQCPLWVRSGHMQCKKKSCPLSPKSGQGSASSCPLQNPLLTFIFRTHYLAILAELFARPSEFFPVPL